MKLLLLPAVGFLLLTSCGGGSSDCSGKQVTCPSFDDNVSLQWVPYKANQKVIFHTSTANDTFDVRDVSLSSSYQASISAGQPYCEAKANFKTAEYDINKQPKFGISISLRHNQYDNTNEKQVYVYLKGGFFQGAGFSDTGLLKSYDLSLSHFYNSTTVGSKTFENIQEIALDTSRIALTSPQIYRIWIARNTGLVAYQEYHGKLWVK